MWRGEPNIPFSHRWEKVGVVRLRVHSDFVGVETPTYKNICPPEFISGSYPRCILPFNKNIFLRPIYTLKTGKMLKRVQHDKGGLPRHCVPRNDSNGQVLPYLLCHSEACLVRDLVIRW